MGGFNSFSGPVMQPTAGKPYDPNNDPNAGGVPVFSSPNQQPAPQMPQYRPNFNGGMPPQNMGPRPMQGPGYGQSAIQAYQDGANRQAPANSMGGFQPPPPPQGLGGSMGQANMPTGPGGQPYGSPSNNFANPQQANQSQVQMLQNLRNNGGGYQPPPGGNIGNASMPASSNVSPWGSPSSPGPGGPMPGGSPMPPPSNPAQGSWGSGNRQGWGGQPQSQPTSQIRSPGGYAGGGSYNMGMNRGGGGSRF